MHQASATRSNCRFNAEAKTGPAFGIFMASVGTLRAWHSGAAYFGRWADMLEIRCRSVVFTSVFLLASVFALPARAIVPAQEVELPNVHGWKINAVKRGSSVMCSARPSKAAAQEITVLADTGKYRDGIWFLQVISRNQHLQPGVQETVAQLSLNGKFVATGTAIATSGAFVRFDFPAIDAFIEDIKSARVIELNADGISSLQLEPIQTIITALEQCQHQATNPQFWKDAEDVCN